jgi:PAS domain S-box-containing protein
MNPHDREREELREEAQALRARLTQIERALAEPGELAPAAGASLTEQRLQQSERLLAEAQELAQLGCWEWDITANRVIWSDSLYRIFGLRPGEAILSFQGYLDRVHPDDRARAQGVIEQALRDQQSFVRDERIVRADGAIRYLRSIGSVIVDERGQPVRMLGLCQDVTERKLIEESLAQERHRIQILLDTLPDSIFFKDAASRFLQINRALAAKFGLSDPAQAIGRSDLDFFPEAFARQTRADELEVMRTGQILRKEEQKTFPDGRQSWTMITKLPLRDPDGRIIGTFGISTDITESKKLEDQLRQAQKMEAIGRLAGGIAHDFNNLLTGIAGYSDILLSDLDPASPSCPIVQEIQKATERAAALTQRLLTFSRKHVLPAQPLHLNAVLADMEPMLRRLIGEDVELLTLPEPDLGWVQADMGQIQQVIVNLVVNARDAMPQGGTLLLQTTNVVLPVRPGETPLPGGPFVRLTVSDTGQGMTPEVRSHLFEPFFTTKEVGKGTGLGLSTSYGIIKQSGGFIEVQSEVGQGTTFQIFLPRVTGPKPSTTVVRPEDESPRGSETILLVEDEDLVRALTLRVLRQLGYTILSAARGEDALRLGTEHAGTIHLLLTDVVMPQMSGREVAERLLPLRPGMKVLYLSGYTDDAMVQHGVRESGMAFLAKPFTPAVLARKVREVLDAPAAPRQDDLLDPQI